ncbi:26S proteasome regulatory subunit N2 [Nematocida minor]|uniref:26S proteasome regulatory subunit N2 n=1 Tax=Nematocida minor TaxID=1912983 RepID=UPI00221EB260|nr:26S proteasome regulatory subunit N2 [Nematocida minor]KAI5192135.1 26S proteasome regulatory subunit N2 [Nematocida minor]
MEAIALVPTIEALLVQDCKDKKKQALDLIIKNVGMIGFLLKDALAHINPSEHPEEKELFHLISAMICFYTQQYSECVQHTILSKNEWFKANSSHCASLDLYFQESRNRVIRNYIETQNEHTPEMKEFMHILLSSEENSGPDGFSLLGLHITTKNISSIEEFIKRNTNILYNDAQMQFLVEEVKKERIYSKILHIFEDFWKSDENERYSSFFYKGLLDSYLSKKDEKSLKYLLNYLADKKTETALYIAFLLHDHSPAISQALSEDINHASVHSLLSGKFQSAMYQKFLSEKNQTNFALLAELSKSQSSKLSMNHMSLSFCNGLMNCKTANDTYLRKNLEWMRQAKNWSKFVVASSFGMIHTDSEDPFEMLRHYLPMAPVRETEKDDPESGGALFALGLISVNSPSVADSFLSTFFDAELESRRNHILHGVCLGLGLTRLGTDDEECIARFKNVLYADAVTTSEAAAYAIGLVSAGRFSHSLANELLTYARDTEHEKISRSVGVSVALQMISAASSEPSDDLLSLLEEMLTDSNSILRYTGALSLGAAYVATGDLSVVGRLLSIISTDASEDVKKIAVFSIGLILTTKSETSKDLNLSENSVLFKVLEPLAQSHSAYVRSGVALVLGMFLAGSGSKQALDVIELLMYDGTAYVRQHASIGAGMILMQVNAKDDPIYRRIVEHMHSMTKRKSESGAARFGALLGRSLLDACGKNGFVSIFGMSGDLSIKSVCGAILFSQFWYWYPLVPFLTLCMKPTLLLAVDTDLKIISDFSVEVEGSEKEHLMTTVTTTDHKKQSKKFKILPLGKEEEKKDETEEKAQIAENEIEEKSHIVSNFGRFTPAQQRKSCLAGLPSVIFMPKSENKTEPVDIPQEIEGSSKMEE